MKQLFGRVFLGVLMLVQGFAITAIASGDEAIKYLGIGNSFTWNSTKFLGEIAESQGKNLEFFVAGIGGSSLEEHLRRIQIFESGEDDPKGKPYKREINGERGSYSLKEVLLQEDWDVVSIQQLSRKSFDYSTYEPFAGELIRYIRKYAPDAEIVVHMTWAYRKDHEWYVQGIRTQEEMYEGLVAAYRELAESYELRINPIGAALQQARSMRLWEFKFPDPDFDYDNPTYPELPRQDGSLINGWYWRENKDDGSREFRADLTHANDAGCYLGGLMHFEFLFGKAPKANVFVPESVTPKQARSLRKSAKQAMSQYRKYNDSVGSGK